MAQLTFPILPDGLVVDVLVNLEAAALSPLLSSGAAPAGVQGKGLIDTGSDISAVALPILHQHWDTPDQASNDAEYWWVCSRETLSC
jgi:hypothetical protein